MSEKLPDSSHENALRESFFKRIEEIKNISADERKLIKRGYNLSGIAHEGQTRASGEPYFEHPRAVALILMDECDVKDPTIIITALLHDTLEDTKLFANLRTGTFLSWKRTAQFELTKMFNRHVAKRVLTLSKPLMNKGNRESELKLYYTWLNESIKERPSTMLVKMADRLHNLRTLDSMPIEKQKRKVLETKDTYIPLFEKFLNNDRIKREDEPLRKKGEYLFKQIEEIIEKYLETHTI